MTMASSAKQERIRWLQEDLCQIDESTIRGYIPMQRLKEEFLRRAMPGTLWSSSRQGFNLRTRHKHPPPPPLLRPQPVNRRSLPWPPAAGGLRPPRPPCGVSLRDNLSSHRVGPGLPRMQPNSHRICARRIAIWVSVLASQPGPEGPYRE